MAITIVNLRLLVNKPAAPSYPASAYTLHKEDWNDVRAALTTGVKGIWTKGAKIGSEGLEFTAAATPVRLPASSMLQFRNGGDGDAVVGSLSADGQLTLQVLRANLRMEFAPEAVVTLDGDRSLTRAESDRTHDTVVRGDDQVEDLDVSHDGDLFALRILAGTFQSDALGHGFAFRNADGVSQLYLNNDGVLALRDVVDPTLRPWTYTNERVIPTGLDSTELVADVLGVDGIEVTEFSASPRVLQAGLLAAGVAASRLDIGPGATQVNVDALWDGGGGSGSSATLVTPAERAAIAAYATRLSDLEAAMATKISALRTADGDLVTPDVDGEVHLANSSTVIFDKPGSAILRAVAFDGGGGGAGVASITAGLGLANTGTATNPILDVKPGVGIVIVSDFVKVDFGTSHTTAAYGDHDHTGVYSPVAHAHTGVYIAVGGAYADLSDAGKIGTGAAQVAAGDDGRFHTQNTDVGTTSSTFVLRRGFAGTAADGDVVGLVVERGAETDARVYFKEDTNKWVAGLSGAEVAIILEGDARLSNTRVPAASVGGTAWDFNDNEVVALRPKNYTTVGRPATAAVGRVIFDTTLNRPCVWY